MSKPPIAEFSDEELATEMTKRADAKGTGAIACWIIADEDWCAFQWGGNPYTCIGMLTRMQKHLGEEMDATREDIN